VRFRNNRQRLLSVSRDGATLNAHVCFRDAPPHVIDAVALLLLPGTAPATLRRARATLRDWPAARAGIAAARQASESVASPSGAATPAPRPAPCAGTPEQRRHLQDAYAALNRTRFGCRLPADLPLRVSRRMSRRFGHVRYHRAADGSRSVIELALNADLLRPEHAAEFTETLLHEMAHLEAWLRHGHRGHGAVWRAIARRVGCEPRAAVRYSLRERRRHG
jgi:hypothetical protein